MKSQIVLDIGDDKVVFLLLNDQGDPELQIAFPLGNKRATINGCAAVESALCTIFGVPKGKKMMDQLREKIRLKTFEN